VKTPLHPAAFRHQITQDELLRGELRAARDKRWRVGKLLDWMWCFCTSASSIGVVSHHHDAAMVLVWLVAARIIVAAGLILWTFRSKHYV
jgi:hypothetical protein